MRGSGCNNNPPPALVVSGRLKHYNASPLVYSVSLPKHTLQRCGSSTHRPGLCFNCQADINPKYRLPSVSGARMQRLFQHPEYRCHSACHWRLHQGTIEMTVPGIGQALGTLLCELKDFITYENWKLLRSK